MFILKKSQLVNTFKQETLKMQNQRTSVFIYFITYYVQLGFFSQLETTLSTPLSAVSKHSKPLSSSGVTNSPSRGSIGVDFTWILGINPRMTFERCLKMTFERWLRMTFERHPKMTCKVRLRITFETRPLMPVYKKFLYIFLTPFIVS